MPKRVHDLLNPPPPPPPPPREPHATIVKITARDPGQAYRKIELVSRVYGGAPRGLLGAFLTGTLLSHRAAAISQAVDELEGAGVLASRSDGTSRYYYYQERTRPEPPAAPM
jgi:hypothetical protein